MSQLRLRAQDSRRRDLGGQARNALGTVHDTSVVGYYPGNGLRERDETLRIHKINQVASSRPCQSISEGLGVDVGTHVRRFLVEDSDAVASKDLVQPRNRDPVSAM